MDDHLAVMSIGFMLPNQDDAIIWRGPRKHLGCLELHHPPPAKSETCRDVVARFVVQIALAMVVTYDRGTVVPGFVAASSGVLYSGSVMLLPAIRILLQRLERCC